MECGSDQIFGDKELKRKLIKSVDSVKKKVRALHNDRAEFANALEETFKPVTQPLNDLLNDKIKPSSPPPSPTSSPLLVYGKKTPKYVSKKIKKHD